MMSLLMLLGYIYIILTINTTDIELFCFRHPHFQRMSDVSDSLE